MVENAVGTFALPFGVGPQLPDQRPGLRHPHGGRGAVGHRGGLERGAGGPRRRRLRRRGRSGRHDRPDPARARARSAARRSSGSTPRAPRCWRRAEELTPGLCRRGAGPRDIEVRLVRDAARRDDGRRARHRRHRRRHGRQRHQLAGRGAGADGGGDRRRRRLPAHPLEPGRPPAARAPPCACRWRPSGATGMAGEEVAERMLYAYEFAYADPYRAATHNKGIMNGVDAVAVATGQRLARHRGRRARVRLRATARIARSPRGRSRTRHLVGTIELPMAVSTVGPVGRGASARAARAAHARRRRRRASWRHHGGGRPGVEHGRDAGARHRGHPEGPHGAARARRVARRGRAGRGRGARCASS